MIKMVKFVCSSCKTENVSRKERNEELLQEETESLTEAYRDHLVYGHEVYTQYEEQE